MKKILICLLFCACSDDDPQPKIKLPIVQTFAEKTTYGVIVKYTITGNLVSMRGYCWNAGRPYPPALGMNNVFNKPVDTLQLSPGVYHFRAFAQNGAGLAYGNTVTLQW